MSDMDMSRRGLLKTSLFGAAAAGMTGIAAAAEAKSSKKAPVYDAIVVGAGPAGLITAITAHDLGAKVVLFEKRDRPDGNAIYALGSVCGWGSRHQKEQGIEDTAEAFNAMMMDVSKQMGDKALNRTYTDNISEGIDWLEKEGVKFGKIKPMPYPRLGRTCRVLGDGLTGGSRLVQTLLAAAKKRGIEILYEHKVIELLHDDHFSVTGVKTLSDEGQKEWLSKGGVCLTTGGFSANPEMVDRYIGGWATRMVLRGSRSTTGENISLALPLYAKFVNMDQFHCGPIVGITHVNPADVLNSGYGVQVNTSGKRFMDEHAGRKIKSDALFNVIGKDENYPIAIASEEIVKAINPSFVKLPIEMGTVKKFNTLEELADYFKINKAPFLEQVERFNGFVAKQEDPEFHRILKFQNGLNLAKGPYYGIEVAPKIHHTMGGVMINPDSQVISATTHAPIKGLYAGGEITGGVHGASRLGTVAVIDALTFGMIAGEHFAAM